MTYVEYLTGPGTTIYFTAARNGQIVWKPVTMKQVADELGVNPSTISRALNGQPGVGEEIRRKVIEAVERLGYRRNAAARNLIKQRAEAIGVVIPRSSEYVFGNPYHFELLQGICEAAKASGYRVLLDMDPDGEFTEPVKNAQADGLVVVHPSVTDARLLKLAEEGIPAVLIGMCFELDIPFVEVDHERSVATVVEHLLETGRERIALVPGHARHPAVVERVAGYKLALARRGREVDERLLVFQSTAGRDKGRAAVRELLARGVAFDAVVAKNDLMALDVLDELASAGISVPNDVAVAGFDGIELGRQVRPSLTTMEQPTRQKAQLAADLLVRLISGEPVAQTAVRMTGNLVIGESTRPPS